jgi:micrococcal nuclease
MARTPATVLPFRRRRAKRRGGWNPIMVMLPLAVFTGVFLWNGRADTGAAEISASGLQNIVPRGWDTSPEALDAAQPAVAGVAADASGQQVTARFGRCHGMGRLGRNCVIDGDTFWYAGEKIRIADINTPEVSDPGCAHEAELGARATERLQALLNEGAFELESVDRDRDQYGRLLRVVTRDGASFGATLVDEGLAEEWRGYRGSWC